jgi:hypothetical protein
MSIQQTDIVDIISTSPEGKTVLTISDHYTWDDCDGHLSKLQEKTNSYLQFIESGQLLESYPQSKSGLIIIRVAMKFKPPENALQALMKFKDVVIRAGYDFIWGTLAISAND